MTSPTITPEALERLADLLAKATAGPWEVGHAFELNYVYGGGSHLGCISSPADDLSEDDYGEDSESAANAALIVALVNAAPALLSTIRSLQAQTSSLFTAIKHGDDDHQAWLAEAIAAHFAGEPVPEPRGGGRKDALIRSLQAKVEGAERALEEARDKFLHYEDLHRLKCTADGDEKADRNREMADKLTEALSLIKGDPKFITDYFDTAPSSPEPQSHG